MSSKTKKEVQCFALKLISELINDIKINFPQLSMTRDVMSGIGGFICWLRSSSHNVMICYPFSCPDTAVCYRLHQQSLLFSSGCKQLWEIIEISFLLSPCLLEVLITECQQWGGRCSCSHVTSVPKLISFVSSSDWRCPGVPLFLLFRCQKEIKLIANL